jgi:nicotinamidase-related amidase
MKLAEDRSRKVAVLVVDLQRDFLEASGRMRIALHQVPGLIAVANTLTTRAAERGVKVVYIGNEFPRSQWLRNVFRHNAALAGSRGGEIDPRVERVSSTYVSKAASDAFSNPALAAFLRAAGAQEVIVLGVFAGACVAATARGAMRAGHRVTLVRDAIGAGSDAARDRALAKLERAGARVTSGSDVVAELEAVRRPTEPLH